MDLGVIGRYPIGRNGVASFAHTLQRMLQAGSAGNNFQPVSGQHYKTVAYRYNTTADAVITWTTSGTSAGTAYAPNLLSVTDGTDEDGLETQVFTDLLGHTVLKRQILSPANLDTYYLYNNAGMLNYIIPPKAMAIMNLSGNYSLTQSTIKPLLFSYLYDSRGRVIQKTVPGNIVLTIVYDPLNRPVLMQDANLAANNQWNYIKYDVKGRAISQGIYTDAVHTGPGVMQGYVTGLASNYATAWYESKNGNSLTGYYTNNIFPNTNTVALAYSFYDNYDLLNNGSNYYPYHPSGLTGDNGATTAQIKGMPTMVYKSTVSITVAPVWLMSVQLYDHNLRPIQSQTNNLVDTALGSTTVTDYKTTVPDFVGMPTVSLISKKSSSSITTTVKTTLAYDPTHRVLAVDQSYNSGTTVHVAAYVYSETGSVVQKKLGSADAVTWLQLVDFRYNIRGQLTSINNSTLTHDGGQTDDDPNPVYGMTLLYDQPDSQLGNTPYYSGRLSAIKWMSKDASNTNGKERAYTYTYDNADRYTGANYAERTGTGAFSFTHGWDEEITGYDENGNIKTLTRNSTTQGSGSYTPIDNLTYTYSSTNANQLYTVTDATGNIAGFGVQTGGSAGGHYAYDTNGNITNDPYKALGITYNVLNKTDKISFTAVSGRYISYIYDSGGNVMEKQQYDVVSGVSTLISTTIYTDGFVYINGALAYFATTEGRVTYNGTTFTNEYTITDQQGNARLSFNNSGTGGARQVIQENSYYGFGMIMPGSLVTGGTNKNLYNGGSEWQNDFTNLPDVYQTFNRNYDAAIGRFVGTDPQPESAAGMSNYQYAGNNPVMANDPMGNNAAPTHHETSIAWTNGVQTRDGNYFGPALGWADAEGGGRPVGDDGTFAELINEFNADVAGWEAQLDPHDYSAEWNSILNGSGYSIGDNGLQYSSGKDVGLGSEDNVTSNINAYKDSQVINDEKIFKTATGTFTVDFATNPNFVYNGSLMHGAQMYIYYQKNGDDGYSSYQWIQTFDEVYLDETNKKVFKYGEDGVNQPFYYPQDVESSYSKKIGVTAYFGDTPGTSGNSELFFASTTLVGIGSDQRLYPIGSFTWGFYANYPNIILKTLNFSTKTPPWNLDIITNHNNGKY